jgi:hypothetical protein
MAIAYKFPSGLTITYGVNKLPGRKRFCLYRTIGTVCTPLAYFKNDNDAKDFLELFNSLVPDAK